MNCTLNNKLVNVQMHPRSRVERLRFAANYLKFSGLLAFHIFPEIALIPINI